MAEQIKEHLQRAGVLLSCAADSSLAIRDLCSIEQDWATSLDGVRSTLDADTANDRTLLLRATTQELGPTREAVLQTAVRRLDLSQKQAAEAYTLAEQHETNLRSIWGYVQGLTRLSHL